MSFIPEVFDEKGQKVTGPEMEAVLKTVTNLAQTAQLARIRKSLEREHIEGEVVGITLDATDERQVVELLNEAPGIPWATVFFRNTGPDDVNIAVNDAFKSFTLIKNEGTSIDLTKADKRVEKIYYWCAPSETATLRVRGKY